MNKYTPANFLKHLSDLATISPAAAELINKINLPTTSRADIASLVSKDEVLFANVFKWVNSPALALVRRPSNLTEAIDVLGTGEIRNLVFSVAAKRVFVDLDLWYKSVFVAFAAEQYCKKIGLDMDMCSDIYLAGLMHSMGTLIFKMFYEQEYAPILEIKNYREKVKAEKDTFGLSGLELSHEAIKEYQLPGNIVTIISGQAAGKESESFKQVNAILDLAMNLASIDKEGINDTSLIEANVDKELIEKFDLAELDISPEVLEQLHSDTTAFVNF